MECGQRSLRVEIDRQDAVASQCQMLRKMRGGRGFPATSLEIDNRYDVKFLALLPVRNISIFSGATVLIEIRPEFKHLLRRVATAT